MCIHTHTCMHAHARTHACTHTYTHTHSLTHSHTYTHTNTHTQTHTHTYTAMQRNTTHSTTHTYVHTHILKRKRNRHRIGIAFEPPAFLVCSIQKQHAVITSRKGDVEIEPASQGAKIKVNGIPLTGKINLNHKDRVLFGKFQFPIPAVVWVHTART